MAQASMEELSRSTQNRPTSETEFTRKMEEQPSRLPSASYLGLALASMIASALIAVFANRKELANFVGLWAPSFLLIGIYNKLVRLERTTEVPSLRRAS